LLGLAGLPLASVVFLTGQPEAMAALVGLRGATEGLQTAGAQAYLVAGAPAGQLGLASAFYFLGGTLGSSLGNLVAGWAVARFGFGALALGLIASGAALTLAAARLLGEPAAAPVERRGIGSGVRGYGDLLRRPEVRLLGCVRFLPTCYWGVMTLLMPLLVFRLSRSVEVVSLYAAVSLLLAAGCQILTGRVIDSISPTRPPLVLTALVPVCAALAALASSSLPALFATGVMGTCVAWSLSATLPPLAREVAGPAEEGRVLGFLHLLWCTAMLGGTLLAGALVDLSAALPFGLVAALNAPTWLAARALAQGIGKRRADARSESLPGHRRGWSC
jgi:MFS family permease